MKDVASCDKLRRVARKRWTWDLRMRNSLFWENSEKKAHAGNWNILVPAGKENKNDSLSSSERKGKRATRISLWKKWEMWWNKIGAKSASRSSLERDASEGDSPVDEADMPFVSKSRASWIGRLNTGELTPNPKYWFKSDSALVPWGKAEKHSRKRVKRLEI